MSAPWRLVPDSPYSVRAAGRPYAVSRATTLTPEGVLIWVYTAWHGEPLVPGRRDIPMPTALGHYRGGPSPQDPTSAAARRAALHMCVAHAADVQQEIA